MKTTNLTQFPIKISIVFFAEMEKFIVNLCEITGALNSQNSLLKKEEEE